MVSVLILSLYGPQSRFGDNWRQITWNLSGLSPKRDSGSEGSSGVFFSVVVVVDCVKRFAFHTRCWILKQSFVPTSNNLQSQESLRSSCRNPFRTAVPFWGQNTQFPSELLPKRDCGPKGVHSIDAVCIDPHYSSSRSLDVVDGEVRSIRINPGPQNKSVRYPDPPTVTEQGVGYSMPPRRPFFYFLFSRRFLNTPCHVACRVMILRHATPLSRVGFGLVGLRCVQALAQRPTPPRSS